MSISVYFAKASKRRNSTLQASFSTSFDCVLKAPTSLDRPTFLLSAGSFDYNLAKFEDKYYFVDDIVSVRNGQFEVSCVLDVLATYKSDIIGSTQYVAYSSNNSSVWLPDTRIPVLKRATVAKNVSTMNFLFSDAGFYVLAAVGKSGCHVYCMDSAKLTALINDISNWTSDLQTAIFSALPFPTPQDETEATANLYTTLMKTGTIGNAYLDAPSCIRSCIWVPFFASNYAGNSQQITLGQYETGITTFLCKSEAKHGSMTITIPWQYSDFRRATCEEVYLYLPLVGMVSIPSDEIVNETSITVEWSATATDGAVCYCVKAGNQIIGTYGANCSMNYPIGVSQQASAGEIMQTAFQGLQKTVSSGFSAASNVNPIGMAGGAVDTALNGVAAIYDTIDTALSAHNSCIGGIGGGAGAGLSLDCACFTVAHPTVIEPSDMAATMGLPTMKPMSLSGLSGFCQCVNAHVATNAQAAEMDAIDAYLNSGFYIE